MSQIQKTEDDIVAVRPTVIAAFVHYVFTGKIIQPVVFTKPEYYERVRANAKN